MAQGWHGNSEGHAKAGHLGGKRSAESRRIRKAQFGEKLSDHSERATSDATVEQKKVRRSSA